jgi:hypothetical protein
VQDRYAVRQLHDDMHVVLDDEYGQVSRDTAHELHGVVSLRRAHPRGWLVEA